MNSLLRLPGAKRRSSNACSTAIRDLSTSRSEHDGRSRSQAKGAFETSHRHRVQEDCGQDGRRVTAEDETRIVDNCGAATEDRVHRVATEAFHAAQERAVGR